MNSKNKKLLSKINSEKRHASITKIKRKRRRELAFIILIFLIFISVVAFMYSPYMKIRNIEVQGYSQITKEEILTAGNINENIKTWSVKDSEVEKNLKDKFNIFKKVTVKSKIPSSIKIEVEEYRLIAQKKLDDGGYQIIMENGQTYNGQIRNSYNLPIVENFENNGKLEEVYKNLAQLKPEVLVQISEIINSKDSEIIIYMKDGQKVKAMSSTFAQKLNYYYEISKYIKDKSKTTLNLINGAYLETEKSDAEKNSKIKELLNRMNGSDSKEKENTKEEKEDKENADDQVNSDNTEQQVNSNKTVNQNKNKSTNQSKTAKKTTTTQNTNKTKKTS